MIWGLVYIGCPTEIHLGDKNRELVILAVEIKKATKSNPMTAITVTRINGAAISCNSIAAKITPRSDFSLLSMG